MTLRSVVKFAVVASALCSMNAFAAGIFSELSSADGQCHFYAGKGTMRFEKARDRAIDYKVTLKIHTLGNGMDLLDHSFVINGQVTRFPIILDEESTSFQKVLVPTSEDTQDDYDSYVETGWGHQLEYEEIHRDEGTPKKRTMLMSFLDKDNNRITEHILAYRDESGKWQLTATGSIGNADGVIFVYTHKLSQTDECSR